MFWMKGLRVFERDIGEAAQLSNGVLEHCECGRVVENSDNSRKSRESWSGVSQADVEKYKP